MNPIRLISLLLAASLLIGLCFAGCEKEPAPATDRPTVTPESPEEIPVRMQNGGGLSFLPEEPLSIPKLSEMVYTRPDVETLIADIEAFTEKIPGCDDAEALLNGYYPIAVQIHQFTSMYSLSYFRYCMDTEDSYYADEYDYCDEQYAIAKEKANRLYAALAASPFRDALEQAYFGEGFFLDYDGFNEADENYYDLKQQENDLLFQYYELTGTINYSNSNRIKQIHEASGKIFIELVKLRRQIAAAKGYENYMDYSYACDFQRDYTTSQAREYLNLVKTMLAPLMQNTKIAGSYSYYSNWNASNSMDMLSAAAERMGGPIWEAFRFMSAYELYDISNAPNKQNTGYTDYLGIYETPVIFVDPSGRDLLTTMFHEFGHYCDFYWNYCSSINYETAETYSQAMEYLAFVYTDPFSDQERTTNLRATLSDLLVYSILLEGAYADFELQVYALAPEELTVEGLDAIFGQCIEDYGVDALRSVRSQSNFWSVYRHFFDYPGYVISYSDSAVAAIQICRLEAEKSGAGVEAFCRLLNRTHGMKFAAVLEETGLDSPFEAETMEKTAEFLKDVFDMN